MKHIFLASFIFMFTLSAIAQNRADSCIPTYKRVIRDAGTGEIIGSFATLSGMSVMNWQLLAISEGEPGANPKVLAAAAGVTIIGGVVIYLSKKKREQALNNTISIIEGAALGATGYNPEFHELAEAINWQLTTGKVPQPEATNEEIANVINGMNKTLHLCPIQKVDRFGNPKFAVFKFKGLRKLIAYQIIEGRKLFSQP